VGHHKAAKPFCAAAYVADAQGSHSRDAVTAVTTYSVRGGYCNAVLENLDIDLTDAEIFHPVKSMAENGGSHGPRFKFNTRLVQCEC
jgi:hypothetical protein